jgi:hypothetical protein
MEGMYSLNDRSPNSHTWVPLVKDAPRGGLILAGDFTDDFGLRVVVFLWADFAAPVRELAGNVAILGSGLTDATAFFAVLRIAGAEGVCASFTRSANVFAVFRYMRLLALERARLNGSYILP